MNTFFQQMTQRIAPVFKNSESTFNYPNICSLSISAQEISLVYAHKIGNKTEIQFCTTVPFSSPENLEKELTALVKQYNLEGMPCIWLLRPDHYQLLSIEALPVPESEFQAAIRWKIKDLIPIPVEEAVIDSFPLPQQKIANPTKMIMIVAARKKYLDSIVTPINKSGLKLTTIDIFELALRNITAISETDDKISALVYFQAHDSRLIITRQRALIMSRVIAQGAQLSKDSDIAHHLDHLALEIQRSFDYFQSQWRYPIPNRVLLSTPTVLNADTLSYLSQQLLVPVQMLDLSKIVMSKIELTPQLQSQYLPLIGSVLREEVIHYATAD